MTDEACGYTRLSYAPDGTLEKTDRQAADIRELAARIGWPVGHVYCDPSHSAWRAGVVRPDWEAMLAAVADGRWRRVIVYHGDRLIRQPRDLERLLALADERRIELASVSGVRDLSNADDRFVLRIEAAAQCRESDSLSRRAKRANRAAAEAGRPRRGRRRPFGYDDDGLTVRPAEAAELEAWVGRLLAGESLHGIVVDLISRGVPTVAGGTWRTTTVRDILTNPRYAGRATYLGETVTEQAAWPGIIDPGDFDDLQAVLAVRGRFGRKGPRDRRYLLSGIARCGSCSGPMRVQQIHGRPVYLCRNHGCPGPKCARAMRPLDEYVIGAVLGALNGGGVEPMPAADPTAAVRAELAAVDARLAEVEAELDAAPAAGGERKPVAMLTRTATRLEARAEGLRARLRAGSRRPAAGLGPLDRDGWDALPLDRRRAVIRDLYVVRCRPARQGGRFDADTVDLVPVD